jgi:hypothetical protein
MGNDQSLNFYEKIDHVARDISFPPPNHPSELLTPVGTKSASGTRGRQSKRLRDSCAVPCPVRSGVDQELRLTAAAWATDRWPCQIV